ncbi:retention module-containing protein [Aliamphritea ceti]|uniref:retention module-containing protein n=1 Tax=Aliamphritea ceti TaxID=1524258 RepID=UPI0021C37098|nr:retention module-containing protein [Aliamphritea ceti]
MASNTPIATVAAMSGVVFARNSDGELRQLQVGDELIEGDVLVPSEGAFVQLAMTDGTYMSFDQPVEVAITDSMVSGEEENLAEAESISDESVAAVLAAIEAGQDPTDVLPAPAAGGAGPNGGEGHDFVVLTRIVETTSPSSFGGQTFSASDSPFISPDLLPVDEAQSPVAVDDAISLDEDSSVIINILGNDSDPDGDLDPTTVTIISPPSNGVISVDPVSGAVTYTPNENYNGPDTFEYIVSDEAGNTSDPATVSITVNPVNDAPVATDNDYDVNEGGQVSGNIISDDTGDGADSDIDNDPLMIATINGQPVVFDQQGEAQIAIGDGTLTINKDGSYTYQHNGEEPEETSFTYTVTDGDLESNSAVVTLNVQQVNDAPVATDNDYNVNEGGQVMGNIITQNTGDGVDSDPENDTLTIMDVNGQPVVFNQQGEAQVSIGDGTLTLNEDGSFTYDHDGSEPAPTSFTYSVSDGNLESNTATVTLSVQQVNDAPVATDNDYNVNEGGQVMGNIITQNTGDGVDSDPENDTLTIMDVNSQPVVFNQQGEAQVSIGDGTLTLNEDGSFTYDHDGSEPAPTSFTYSVSDGSLESNTATVTLSVQQVNDAPVATDNEYNVNEGGQVMGNIITQNTGDGVDSDPENDTLTIMDVNGQPVVFNQQGEAQVSIGDGTLTLNEDGSFTYDHDGSEPAPTSFTYSVSDGNLESNTATVTLSVQQVNDAPVATDNDYNVNEGGQVMGNIITQNTGDGVDSDPENDTLTIMDVNGQPVVFNQQGEAQVSIGDGTLTLSEDGSFTYDHDGSEPAPTSFTYSVSDGNLESNTATVTLSVQQVNDAPVATDNDYNVNEGGQVMGNIITQNTGDGVDSDPENDTLTIMDVNGQPVVFNQQGEAQVSIGDGTLTLSEDGSFTYDHDGSEPAPTSFTYSVSDGNLESNTATVTLSVQQVNDAPVATDNDYNVNEGGQVMGNIITQNTGDGVDSDPENDTLTIMDVNGQPVVFNQQGEAQVSIGDGTLTLNEDGSFTYDHDGSEPAPTSFTYSVSDGNLESNTATVTLSVQQVNDAPVATDNDYNVNEGGQVMGNIITQNTGDGVDSDPENDTLTIMDVNGQPVVFNQQGEAQISIGDGTLTLNEDGSFTYDHDGSEPAPTSFTYSVSDGSLESNTATVTLSVQQVNDAPVATDNDYNVNEGGQVMGNIITQNTGDGVDSDPENDTLTIMDVNGQPVVFNQQGEAQVSIGDGTLTLNEDGSFTYDHDGSEPAPTSFTYSVSDGNLESNTATVTLSIQPVDEPVTLDMTGSEGEVYDVGILSDMDDSETTNSSFKVNAPDGLASVTIAGNILLVADLLAATELAPLTVFSDANEEMVITGYDANTGTINYSYSLVTAVSHAPNSDQTMTSFEVTAKDSDGSVSDPGFIVITQNDDVPEVIALADGMGINGETTVVGTLSIDPSADTPQTFIWGEFTPSTTLYANDEPIGYIHNSQTQTITGVLADNTVVFTLQVNDDMDTYTYTQYLPIQTEATDVAIGANLSGGNSDSFRL